MKIAITAQDNKLTAEVDPRFGRCGYFIIIHEDQERVNIIPNTNMNLDNGAGVKSAELIANSDAEVLLTGNVGPSAMTVLKAGGIKVFCGVKGSVAEVAQRFWNGEYKNNEQPTVDSHFGK